MNAHDEFIEAFDRFMEQTSVSDALSVATGLFVGLVVSYTKHRGHDANKEITINGGDQRDITIHPAKNPKEPA